MDIKEAAEKVLMDAGKPLHIDEITRQMIKEGLWTTSGKTPSSTVGARLYCDIDDNKDKSRFIKIKPSVFSLRDMTTLDDAEKGYTFLDAAEMVLKLPNSPKEMHYGEITKVAIDNGLLITEGKTPEATMIAQITTDMKRAKSRGENGRFVKGSRGLYGLAEQVEEGLAQQIATHREEVEEQLLSNVKALSPKEFEELVGQLLAEMGFDDVEVTKIGGDGGIDVRGTLQIGDVIRIKMAVQAKRWENNVQSPTVQQVRGSLGNHEQGLIITTSNFSEGARAEANQADRDPVALMNGEQLVKLLMEYNIGVRRIPQELFEIGKIEL